MTDWVTERMRREISGAVAWLIVALAFVVFAHPHTGRRHAQVLDLTKQFTPATLNAGLTDTDADDDPDLAGHAEPSTGPICIAVATLIDHVIPADVATPHQRVRLSLGSRAPPSSSI